MSEFDLEHFGRAITALPFAINDEHVTRDVMGICQDAHREIESLRSQLGQAKQTVNTDTKGYQELKEKLATAEKERDRWKEKQNHRFESHQKTLRKGLRLEAENAQLKIDKRKNAELWQEAMDENDELKANPRAYTVFGKDKEIKDLTQKLAESGNVNMDGITRLDLEANWTVDKLKPEIVRLEKKNAKLQERLAPHTNCTDCAGTGSLLGLSCKKCQGTGRSI